MGARQPGKTVNHTSKIFVPEEAISYEAKTEFKPNYQTTIYTIDTQNG